MGCDYYINKYLEIKFQNKNSLRIELESNRGYYSFSLDEDDPDYDEKYQEYVENILKPSMKPIIIFENNQFLTETLENKYKFLIEHEMDKYNKYSECKIGFTDIIKIVKRESRYERE